MARLDQQGFELNSTTATVLGCDTLTGCTIGTSVVRSGSYALRVSSLASATRQGVIKKFVSASAAADIYFRAYICVVTLPTANNSIMNLGDSTTLGTSVICSISLQSTGKLILLNTAGTQIGSASASIGDGKWHMVELRSNTVPASGSRTMAARLDGSVFATTSTGTQANCSNITVGGNLSAEAQTVGEWWFDDLAINDNTGSFQNSYPGSGKVIQLYPDGAGDSNTFATRTGGTSGGANNYTRVDEVTPDDATSFNGSSTLNQEDFFTTIDSGLLSNATVNTVLVGARFRNSTADTAATLKLEICKTSGGTIAQGSAITPNTTTWNTNATASPRNYTLITYQDPDAAAWTQTTIDSMQIGYKLTTGPSTGTRRVDISTVWASVDYTPVDTTPSTTTGDFLALF